MLLFIDDKRWKYES